jgi:hypothetical protein
MLETQGATMRQFVVLAGLVMALAGWMGSKSSVAAAQTWIGYVSDSQCGADHGGEVDPRECTLKCIAAGDKFVLVVDSGKTILPITNQDFPALRDFAGEEAKVTGELSGGAIVIASIDKP